MTRKLLNLLLALSLSTTGLTACDVPEEACNCSKSEEPPTPMHNAEFWDRCESDDDCVSDEENFVCSSGRCTVECSPEWPVCPIYNYRQNGILIREYSCEADNSGQDVCVEI